MSTQPEPHWLPKKEPPAPPAKEKPTLNKDVAPWPRPMDKAALYGLPGNFIRLVEPHTEADRNWLLLVFLVYAGNVLGRNRFFAAGGGIHRMRIFAVGVGPTATGRKGTANSPVEDFFKIGPRAPGLGHLLTGVSSGEGLIWEIRDKIIRKEKNKKTGKYEDVVVDAGVEDKRLIVNCGEFQGVLAVMRREGSTVSRIIRDFWDRDLVVAPTKNSPAITTACHVSFIGNITREELLQTYQQGDANNGVLNRFLWGCSQRSKLLPEGGGLWELMQTETGEWSKLQSEFNTCSPTQEDRVAFDSEAADIWGRNGRPGGLYEELSAARYGLTGAVTYRAAQHVLRLALVYATLDKSVEIRRQHLDAALEIWRYCEDSARYIFGNMQEDPAANAILEALTRRAPDSLTRTEISSLFGRHYTAGRLNMALQALHDKGLARFERAETNGRPVELWLAVGKE